MSEKDVIHLISAAVVNVSFAELLLLNPRRAIEQGYQGEKFDLTDEELQRILSIKATNLMDFANQLLGGQTENS